MKVKVIIAFLFVCNLHADFQFLNVYLTNSLPANGPNSQSIQSNTNISNLNTDLPALEQNVPNPFNQNTYIKYYIPSTVQQSSLIISDIAGRTLMTLPINVSSYGKQTITAGQLAAGTYNYTLTLDGNAMDTKQMMLTR